VKPLGAEGLYRLVLDRVKVRVEGGVNGGPPLPDGLVFWVTDVEDGTAGAVAVRMEKPFLEVEGGGEVILGPSGLPINARFIEPQTVFSLTFTENTPARSDINVLVLDGTHESVKVSARVCP
jgi:hypothetical protein